MINIFNFLELNKKFNFRINEEANFTEMFNDCHRSNFNCSSKQAIKYQN
jgi:hypothetical protein